eukprot:symbB.v1.2.024422.t1/scaffold2312.1/size82648/4
MGKAAQLDFRTGDFQVCGFGCRTHSQAPQIYREFTTRFNRQGPESSWLKERGFGGCERISHLREMLCHFKRLGVECRIVSYADRAVIERTMTILEMADLFVEISGLQEIGRLEG